MDQVWQALERWGLVLLQDPKLPSVAGIVAGEVVRGSWWGHARGKEIFAVASALDDHDDVAAAKLVSGKVTFVHRRLWPALIAVGSERAAWQTDGLGAAARALLACVDDEQRVQASGKAAGELERALLVAGRQVHTESGAHAQLLTTWRAFARDRGVPGRPRSAAKARAELDAIVRALDAEFGARATLPWW